MKYTDFQLIWRFESMIFRVKHFFRERSLHTTVHKLRGASPTLGHAGRKKYFNDFLFHFGQKMGLALGSMTFQTFCIFRTGYRNIGMKKIIIYNKFPYQCFVNLSQIIVFFLQMSSIQDSPGRQ